jgi:tetratricopeptide (TPR) repeat protein
MPASFRWRALAAAVWLACLPAAAQQPAQTPQDSPPPTGARGAPAGAVPTAAAEPPGRSALDAPLFYQLLIGEIELRGGQPGTAFEVILDAARRTRDESLFRRAADIAIAARAGEQALAATRAWRIARPESPDALRLQLQVLVLLNRAGETAEPLRRLLELTPADERGGVLASLPRFMQRAGEPRAVAKLVEDAATPYLLREDTRVAARVAIGRAWLAAKDSERALALAQEAAGLDTAAPGPALLALEMLRERPEAERLVTAYLAQPNSDAALRLAYARALTGSQRYADAIQQLETATRQQPELAGPWLTLGALHLELRQNQEGEAALLRYVDLASGQGAGPAAGPAAAGHAAAADDDDDDDATGRPDQGLIQAWLMLAQSAQQRGDFAAAERWLARIDDPQRALDVQTRRASILARQGKVEQARELIRRTPERKPEDARAKVVAEAGVLREAKRWRDAHELLAQANQKFADDGDLLYEQAMMAEKLNRVDEMERLLRRAIELRPENAHAHNALGYTLADRGVRLGEARALIARALELSPGDPFITDSLGWVEFRMGRKDEALRLLRQAWQARPDTEIGAHLGEVLWSMGQQDEARRIWRDAKGRDAANEVLRETLARLKVEL